MKRHVGGEPVRGGYYWSLSRWEIIPVAGASGSLPGEREERYWRLPLPLIPVAVMLMAVVCVCYVPAIGFVMVGWAAWKRARQGAPKTEITQAKPRAGKAANEIKVE